MRILAIDTVGPTLGLALVENGAVVVSREDADGLRHTENLLPRIDAIVSETGWPRPLDGVCVSSGPGSFTGLRIGVATAKAIAFAWDVSAAFVNTLDGLAYSEESLRRDDAKPVDAIVPILDARKGRYYAALFAHRPLEAVDDPDRAFIRESDDRDVSIEEVAAFLGSATSVAFPGPDSILVADTLGYANTTVVRGSGVVGVGVLGYRRIESGVVAGAYDGPFYLREGDVGERKRGPRFAEDSGK